MLPAESYSLPESFSLESRQELLDEIIRIYDLADKVMSCIMREGITRRAVQHELTQPFVGQAVNLANTVVVLYREVASGNALVTPEVRNTIEDEFRTFFAALDTWIEGVEEKLMT